MLSTLILKEARVLSRLMGWFVLVALLCWVSMQLAGGAWDEGARTAINYMLFAVLIPGLYTLFASSYLMAGEKSVKTMPGLCALPVPLATLWRVKFFAGLIFCLVFSGMLASLPLLAAAEHGSGLSDDVLRLFSMIGMFYAVAFLVSCLARSTLGSAIIGATVGITCIVSILMAADALSYKLASILYANRGHTGPQYSVTFIDGCAASIGNLLIIGLSLALALLAAWSGYHYVCSYHRRPRLQAAVGRMIARLIAKELRGLRLLLGAFLLLTLVLVAVVMQYRASLGVSQSNLNDLVPLLFVGLSALFSLAIASDLVAGEKERRTLDAVLQLPVPPAMLWRAKMLAGLGCAVAFNAVALACIYVFSGATESLFQPGRVITYVFNWDKQLWLVILLPVPLFVAGMVGSCLTRGTITGTVAGALLALVTGILCVLLGKTTDNYLDQPYHYGFPEKPLIISMADDIVRWGLFAAALIIGVWFSRRYFARWHHRSFISRRLRIILGIPPALVAALLALSIVYAAIAAVVNHPAMNQFTPRVDTARYHDPANRAANIAYMNKLKDWNGRLRTLLPDEGYWSQEEWETEQAALSDSVASLLRASAGLRSDMLENPVGRPPVTYVDSTTVPDLGDDYCSPMFYISIYKLESLAAHHAARRGDMRAAQQSIDRMLARAGDQLDSPPLFRMLVGTACTTISADALRDIFPLTGGSMPGAAALEYAARLEKLEMRVDGALAEALVLEAAAFDGILAVRGEEYPFWARYPFMSEQRLRQSLQDVYLWLIDDSRRNYWEIGDVPPDAVMDFAWWEQVFRPSNVLFVESAIPPLRRLLENKAKTLRILRMARLHLYLYAYRQQEHRWPVTLDDLYARFAVAPLVDPLTGQLFRMKPAPGDYSGKIEGLLKGQDTEASQ